MRQFNDAEYHAVIERVNTCYVRGESCVLLYTSHVEQIDAISYLEAGVRNYAELRGIIETVRDMVKDATVDAD